MSLKYRNYFDIDPEYFPAVDEKLIDQGKVDWRKFYPHETFVKLLKSVVRVLNRQDKLSLWVEGSYGTGKSHAVLTLKKLLDAPVSEVEGYFQKYGLDKDLMNHFIGLKNKEKQILTVHRYGSSSIYGDRSLILAVQESVKKALQERGIKNQGDAALKDAVLAWLQKDINKEYFNNLITRDFASVFGGISADDVILKLQQYKDSDAALITLMEQIFKVADAAGITALNLDIDGLVSWLTSVIDKNNLHSIVFIWDEFTEYFTHNRNALTGFQRLAQMSASQPFYLCIVTHKSGALFNDADSDKSKILDRFVSPTCKLELPENIAFRLMGQALSKNPDPAIRKEWAMYSEELDGRLKDSRQLVEKAANISEQELKDILPIHPYTALLLKHISSAYASDQRSMFDFIKNDRGEEIKGFQWFIDNYGPLDDNPLLTIDMLWDFFYEKGKNNLPTDVRSILDTCAKHEKSLNAEMLQVLRTVLLLQAISQRVGGKVETFIPNSKNIANAYDGTDLEGGQAINIADYLAQKGILYKKTDGGMSLFGAMTGLTGEIDPIEFERYKKEALAEKTVSLIVTGGVAEFLSLPPALNMRYKPECAGSDNLTTTVNKLCAQDCGNKLRLVVTFARNDEESASNVKLIREKLKDPFCHVYYIDTGLTPFGMAALNQYAENKAYSRCYSGKDNKLSDEYAKKALEILADWKAKIADGEFKVYSKEWQNGMYAANLNALYEFLKQINLETYPLCPEGFINGTETMYSANSLKQGVKCGVEEQVGGAYNSANPTTKLENALKDAWKVPDYWKGTASTKPIGRIKNAVESLISKSFAESGRVSIKEIYDMLAGGEYGFMPCNLTAFVLGFLLKEYAKDTFQWSDGQTSAQMSVSKLQEMVDEIIKLQNTPNSKYKDKYIVAMTDEEKSFRECASKVFHISLEHCESIEKTRTLIRSKMKDLMFPLWCVKHVSGRISHTTSTDILNMLLDDFVGVCNNNNMGDGRSETDIAMEIGAVCRKNTSAIADLCALVTKENCRTGMQEYLKIYANGILPELGKQIDDHGNYLNVLKNKFDADSAIWVWSQETVNQKIDEVITEYRILLESRKAGINVKSINEALDEWREKANTFKIPYMLLGNIAGEAKPFLDSLMEMKQSAQFSTPQREKFLNVLQKHLTDFQAFYTNQLPYFKESGVFYLDGFSDEECSAIYDKLPGGSFCREKSEYFTILKKASDEFKQNQGKTKLHNFWKEKTGTMSPREWSSKNRTPIFCIIPTEELNSARKCFQTIHSINPDAKDVENALSYLEHASFLETSDNAAAIDKAFMEKIIGNFATMLPKTDDVREYLFEKVSSDPYEWFGSPEVVKKLEAFAQSKYETGGSEKALAVIENMAEDKVKEYLKRLVKNNMIVGIEIIKDN